MSMDKTIAKMRQEAEELQIALRVFDRMSGNGHRQAGMGAIERAIGMHREANGNGLTSNGKKIGRPPMVRTQEEQPRLIPGGRQKRPVTKARHSVDRSKGPYVPRPGKELPEVETIPDLDVSGVTAYEGMKAILKSLRQPVGVREMAARLQAQGQPLKDPRGLAVLLTGLVYRDKAFKRLKGDKDGKGATFVYKGA